MDNICQAILVKAKAALGGEQSEGASALLGEMCEAAHFELGSRLREGVSVSDIYEQYIKAAGILAVSMFVGLRPSEAESFTAGSVSMRLQSAREVCERARLLRTQAELMLAGYLKEQGFRFEAVRS